LLCIAIFTNYCSIANARDCASILIHELLHAAQTINILVPFYTIRLLLFSSALLHEYRLVPSLAVFSNVIVSCVSL
jgi:hypothetical protein